MQTRKLTATALRMERQLQSRCSTWIIFSAVLVLLVTGTLTAFMDGTKYKCKMRSPCDCDDSQGFCVINCVNLNFKEVPRDVPDAAFSLNLSNNDITVIHRKDFRKLFFLAVLDLSENKISKIRRNSFRPLYSLIVLVLSDNRLGNIENDTFRDLVALDTLGLSKNNITTITPGCLVHLKKLIILQLSGNQIKEIEEGSFPFLPKLKTLDLSENKVESISTKAFDNLPNLETLSLFGNNVSEITTNNFLKQSLKILDLSHNNIDKISEKAFVNLSNLTSLNIGGNKLTHLSEQTFYSMGKLEELDMSSNYIPNLPSKLFTPLTKLSFLGLASNGLVHLPTDIFSPLTNLNQLSLAKNGLVNISHQLLHGLNNLLDLDMTENKVSKFHGNTFQSLRNLQRLSFSKNHLTYLPEGLFHPIGRLTYLDISENMLKQLRSDTFWNLTNLKILYMEQNILEELPERLFHPLTSLTDLHLEENKLRKLHQNIFAKLSSLENLVLSGNRMNDVPEEIFCSLKNLQTLDLSLNFIKNLPVRNFQTLQNLYTLDLGVNRIERIRQGTFVNMSQIYRIDLSENHINEFEEGSFFNLPKLQDLLLSDNRLDTIPKDAFSTMPNLLILDMSFNNFKTITRKSFSTFQEYGYLLLSNNRISSLRQDVFHETSVLVTLDMSSNLLTELPLHLFDSNPEIVHFLRTLLLQRNKLNYLPENVFQGLPYLKSLCLFQNNIKIIAERAFSNTGVQHIYLFRNELTVLSNNSFESNVTQLHLYGNKLTRVSSTALVNLKIPANIYLSCGYVEEVQRINVGMTCVTPQYIPTIKVEDDDVKKALQKEGFSCKVTTTTLFAQTSECTPCQRGTYGDGRGSCLPCPQGGYFQDGIGSIPKRAGEMDCLKCPNGTYVRTVGATSIDDCKVCPDGTDKKIHAGFRACHCSGSYARTDRFGPCYPCIGDGYNCSGIDYQSIKTGYFWNWNFSSANLTGYKWFVKNLQNETRFFSNASSDTRYSMEIPQVFKCPRINSCNVVTGGIEVRCSKGYRGWLCNKCERDYFSVIGACIPCPSYVYFVVEVVITLAIVLIIILLAIKTYARADKLEKERNVSDMILSRGKIALGFYQIVGEFLTSFNDIHFIGSMYIVGEIFFLLELNVLRLLVKPRCLHEKLVINPKSEFIIVMSFLPIFILAVYAVFKVKVAHFKYRHSSIKNDRIMDLYRCKLASKMESGVVILLFVTYPSICTSIFQLYPRACHTFCLDANKTHCIHLLRSDFDINCKDMMVYHISAYLATLGYVITFPALLYFALRKNVHVTFSKKTNAERNNVVSLDTSVVRERCRGTELLVSNETKTPVWMEFLCENYKPQYWYWEIVELVRKMTQTVLITVLGWQNKFTVLFTIGIAVLFLILHARCLPMKSKFEQGLQMFSLVAIFINVLLAGMKFPVEKGGALSIALILLNIAVITIIVGEAVLKLLYHLRRMHFLRIFFNS